MSAPFTPVEYRASLGIRPMSPAWAAFVHAVYGVPLTPEERPLFKEMSGGRSERPGVGWFDSFGNGGRGSGKDDTGKTIGTFECRHGGHEISGSPGQRLPYDVICPLRGQAQGFLRMAAGEANLPPNRRHVVSTANDSVEFANGCLIRVVTCDDVAVTGDTAIGADYNEYSLWPGEMSATPASVIEGNHGPSLRRVVGAPPKRVFRFGSSYIRDGRAWEIFRDDFGRDDADILVVSGSTEFFNPNIDKDWLARERKRLGELLYAMHFGSGVWLDAVTTGFFPESARQRCTRSNEPSIPIEPGTPLVIAIDAKFSESTSDRFGWCVASSVRGMTTVHYSGSWVVDRKPREMAIRVREELCEPLRTRSILLDQYSAAVFAQMCEEEGLFAEVVNWTGGDGEGSKTSRYHWFKTAMIGNELSLPDIPELTHDICACQEVMLPGGGSRIGVSRSKRGHGDTLSATIMACTEAARGDRWAANVADALDDAVAMGETDYSLADPGVSYQ